MSEFVKLRHRLHFVGYILSRERFRIALILDRMRAFLLTPIIKIEIML